MSDEAGGPLEGAWRRSSGRQAPRHTTATSIHGLLTVQAAARPEAVALVATGRPPLTYRRLLSQVEAMVAALNGCGLGRGDRVAVVLPNGPEMAVAFAAVAAGATCAPLNPAYRASEFEAYLTDLRARALLVSPEQESPARQVAQRCGLTILELRVGPDGLTEVSPIAVAPGAARAAPSFTAPDDVALVLHTSGSTARPKIVPLTQKNICASAYSMASSLALTEADRCLNVMPLFHIHGLVGALLSSWAAGASVVTTPGFDAEKFFTWLDVFHPTWYTAVPAMHHAVLARAAANREIITRRPLRFVRSCSATLSRSTMIELEAALGTQVIEAYGMTEASHQIATNPLAPLPRKAGSVGVAAGTELAIMDADGLLLPIGEVGEVVVRGPGLTRGYESDVSADASAFTNGWFRTGDEGRLDADGYLFLTGRLKETINRGGEKIAPGEIDDVLTQHPAIRQAIVFAVPHPTLGEDLAAAVVLKDGVAATEAEIRDYAAVRLAEFKVPRQLLIVDSIPSGATGKPQRSGLAERLADKLTPGGLGRETEAPRTSVEAELMSIWRSLLSVQRVSRSDSFYALGGDSLALASMLVAVEARFGKTVPLDSFLASPTVDGLASLLATIPPGVPAPSARDAGAGGRRHPLRDSLLGGVRNRLLQWVALYIPGHRSTRVWLHRLRGVSIGDNVSIGVSTLIETAYPRLVSIGSNVSIGMRTIIIGHLRELAVHAVAAHEPTVRIEDDVYIGPGVIVLPHVTIGRGAVVSAGSVVSRSIPPRTLARGNPAQPIARCGMSLAGGASYEEFLRHLAPLDDREKPLDGGQGPVVRYPR